MKRLSRKQRRMIEHGDLEESEVLKEKIFKIRTVRPITENQKQAFEDFYDEQNLLLTGSAGTGKTFIACYLGLNEVLQRTEVYESLTIVRSVVPTRDMGFIPGKIHEKQQVYEMPYVSIFQEMSMENDKGSYGKLKNDGLINFISTSFIRGHTLRNTIVVVDEIQNMNFNELWTVITRIGKNCKIIFCGDIKQNDLYNQREQSGFDKFFKIINSMDSFSTTEFNTKDIVRSDVVKEFIITAEKLNISPNT
jgi:predicted ribonuclease YlaK